VSTCDTHCKIQTCSEAFPPPSPPPPARPPIPVGECRPWVDYDSASPSTVPTLATLTGFTENRCSDFPDDLVFGYMAYTCAELECDTSQFSASQHNAMHALARMLCRLKCGGCAEVCQDKPNMLAALNQLIPFVPGSCEADWAVFADKFGYCEVLYRVACSSRASPTFCEPMPPPQPPSPPPPSPSPPSPPSSPLRSPPLSPLPSPPPPPGEESVFPIAVVIGVAVGAVLCIGVGVAVYICCRHRKSYPSAGIRRANASSRIPQRGEDHERKNKVPAAKNAHGVVSVLDSSPVPGKGASASASHVFV